MMLPFCRQDDLTKVVVRVRELTKDEVVGGVLLRRGDVEVTWPDGRSSFFARHYYRRRFVPIEEAESSVEHPPTRFRFWERSRLPLPRRLAAKPVAAAHP